MAYLSMLALDQGVGKGDDYLWKTPSPIFNNFFSSNLIFYITGPK